MCKSYYFSIAAAALLSLTSCQALIKEDRINCTAPVTVRVQDFGICMEEFPGTKATSAVAAYEGVKEITLAFYSGHILMASGRVPNTNITFFIIRCR